ncbi:hypothetical protein AB835_04820 [Candidatus Endobugula sertula]|uniref:Uncharacterized protein n=1 Tax=Candidatus Endobugula sertula TaxID=62101 RepID=A0A1D2QRJ9_9GAMM|nr:hypothetical protein AB835_04820 [Candidatus Endobugula sertula]
MRVKVSLTFTSLICSDHFYFKRKLINGIIDKIHSIKLGYVFQRHESLSFLLHHQWLHMTADFAACFPLIKGLAVDDVSVFFFIDFYAFYLFFIQIPLTRFAR